MQREYEVKNKLLITVPVYGDVYSDIFLKYQLKGFLDPTNVPACADRVDFAFYTDGQSLNKLMDHENFKALRDFCPSARFFTFSWPDNADRFGNRYSVLISTFRMSVNEALTKDSYLSAIVADLVPAKGFIPKMLKRLDDGHDAVFNLPLRSAMESMRFTLDHAKGALSPLELCELGYANLHPLWVACHWDAAQFTKLPFSLLWNSGRGLLARSYSITPIAFVPTHQMLSVGKVIDVEVPGMFKNPYWANDWVEAPILGVEPLQCYYPPWQNQKASEAWVSDWASTTLDKTQIPFLRQELWYPSKAIVAMSEAQKFESDRVVKTILGD